MCARRKSPTTYRQPSTILLCVLCDWDNQTTYLYPTLPELRNLLHAPSIPTQPMEGHNDLPHSLGICTNKPCTICDTWTLYSWFPRYPLIPWLFTSCTPFSDFLALGLQNHFFMSTSTWEDSSYLEWEASPNLDDEERQSSILYPPTSPLHIHMERTCDAQGDITHTTTYNGWKIPSRIYILPRGPTPPTPISPLALAKTWGNRKYHEKPTTIVMLESHETYHVCGNYPEWEDFPNKNDEAGSSYIESPPRSPICISPH